MARRAPRRAPAVCILAGAVLLASAGSAADLAGEIAKRRELTRLYIEHLHMSPESVDLESLLAEVEARSKAGDSRPVIAAWLAEEVKERWLSFAPIDPTPRASHRYELPFDRRVHWIVVQGVSTEGSHQGSNELALDFAMPEGTEVLAARSGKVARVVDGFTQCCLPRERSFEANAVLVLHDDGSFASYAHLRPGIPVKEGQPVEAGDLLGYSGNTGFSLAPHLHFQVSTRKSRRNFRSVPFSFENGTRDGYRPVAWNFYVNRLPPAVALRISLDGRDLVSGQPLPVPVAPAQLRVERLDASGGPVDVTRDPATRYVALTPWSAQVDSTGRVLFGPSAEVWDRGWDATRPDPAIVTILYRDAEGRDGYFDALLDVRAGAAPPAPGDP